MVLKIQNIPKLIAKNKKIRYHKTNGGIMAQIFKNCTSCKKLITIFSENKTTLCKHCGTEFETDSLLDDSEKTFVKSLS